MTGWGSDRVAYEMETQEHPESCECDECELDYQSEITASTEQTKKHLKIKNDKGGIENGH